MRRSFFVFITIALAALVSVNDVRAVSPADVKKASRAYSKGERAYRTGDMEKAASAFQEALEIAPGFPEANLGLGHIAMSEQRFGDALDRYRQARDGYAEVGDAMLKLRQKRYNDTLAQIQGLRDQAQLLATTSSNAGLANLRISQIENRISQLEVIEPPDRGEATEPPGEIYFNIGNALYQLVRVDEAIASWETCREKSPGFAMVYNNLALAYMRTGKLNEAMTSLAKAEELGFSVNPQFKADLRARASKG